MIQYVCEGVRTDKGLCMYLMCVRLRVCLPHLQLYGRKRVGLYGWRKLRPFSHTSARHGYGMHCGWLTKPACTNTCVAEFMGWLIIIKGERQIHYEWENEYGNRCGQSLRHSTIILKLCDFVWWNGVSLYIKWCVSPYFCSIPNVTYLMLLVGKENAGREGKGNGKGVGNAIRDNGSRELHIYVNKHQRQ